MHVCMYACMHVCMLHVCMLHVCMLPSNRLVLTYLPNRISLEVDRRYVLRRLQLTGDESKYGQILPYSLCGICSVLFSFNVLCFVGYVLGQSKLKI